MSQPVCKTCALPDWPILRDVRVPLRLRKKIAKFYPSLPSEAEFDAQVFGQNYHGCLGIHIDDKVFLFGAHEPASIRLMRGLLRYQRSLGQSPFYLDVGTNTGQHLVAVSPCADRAFGFEPYKPVRDMAIQNVRANHLGHVEIFDFGLSDCNADLPFTPPQGNNLGVGTFLDQARGESSARLTLSVRNGDEFIVGKQIVPTVIKIDTEGFEKKVLTGLKETIRACHPAVVFEYSAETKNELGSLDTLRDIFGNGYHYFGIARSREYPKLVPFDPKGKYENVLALPYENIPLLDFS